MYFEDDDDDDDDDDGEALGTRYQDLSVGVKAMKTDIEETKEELLKQIAYATDTGMTDAREELKACLDKLNAHAEEICFLEFMTNIARLGVEPL